MHHLWQMAAKHLSDEEWVQFKKKRLDEINSNFPNCPAADWGDLKLTPAREEAIQKWASHTPEVLPDKEPVTLDYKTGPAKTVVLLSGFLTTVDNEKVGPQMSRFLHEIQPHLDYDANDILIKGTTKRFLEGGFDIIEKLTHESRIASADIRPLVLQYNCTTDDCIDSIRKSRSDPDHYFNDDDMQLALRLFGDSLAGHLELTHQKGQWQVGNVSGQRTVEDTVARMGRLFIVTSSYGGTQLLKLRAAHREILRLLKYDDKQADKIMGAVSALCLNNTGNFLDTSGPCYNVVAVCGNEDKVVSALGAYDVDRIFAHDGREKTGVASHEGDGPYTGMLDLVKVKSNPHVLMAVVDNPSHYTFFKQMLGYERVERDPDHTKHPASRLLNKGSPLTMNDFLCGLVAANALSDGKKETPKDLLRPVARGFPGKANLEAEPRRAPSRQEEFAYRSIRAALKKADGTIFSSSLLRNETAADRARA